MQQAPRVHRDGTELERLGAMVAQAEEGTRVELTFANGRTVTGVILAKPVLQAFLGPEGEEGSNALLSLGEVSDGRDRGACWLDEVSTIVSLADTPQGRR